MGTALIILLIAVGLLVVAVLVFFGIYNGLVRARIGSETAWSDIDVQLKRRHDLIPNLVNSVKGYASHEKETLENVVKARESAVGASGVAASGQAEGMLSAALGRLPSWKAMSSYAGTARPVRLAVAASCATRQLQRSAKRR